ncbi:MAG: amino acid ABC transporter permease [Desulfobacterales bacterium]|nr:MAG: amino acid ABC transporter permease [Desulfobacterales bacterium]
MDWLLDGFNFRVLGQYSGVFGHGMFTTVWMSFVCLICSVFFGIFLAIARMAESPFLWRPAAMYIQAIRATPLLIQIYLVYYGLPSLLPFGHIFNETQTALIALTIHTTPYMAEIIRAGIDSVSIGQIEGARSVGMSSFQTFHHVVLPQALANVTPPMLGQTAVLIKDTSYFSIIAVFELMGAGLTMFSETVMPTESYVATAVCYLIIYLFTLAFSEYIKKRLGGSAWQTM